MQNLDALRSYVILPFGQHHRVSSRINVGTQAVSHHNPCFSHSLCHTATQQPSHPKTVQNKVHLTSRSLWPNWGGKSLRAQVWHSCYHYTASIKCVDLNSQLHSTFWSDPKAKPTCFQAALTKGLLLLHKARWRRRTFWVKCRNRNPIAALIPRTSVLGICWKHRMKPYGFCPAPLNLTLLYNLLKRGGVEIVLGVPPGQYTT